MGRVIGIQCDQDPCIAERFERMSGKILVDLERYI